MIIRENVPISTLTTMRLGGPARYVCEVAAREDIEEALSFAREKQLPVWFMGGGANTIGHDEGFSGVVILSRLRGITKISDDANVALYCAMGGEIWDDFVAATVAENLSGIEAMSLIPGTVGAAPVQNIGAYGQDIANVIISAEAYDTAENKFVTLQKNEMHLGYRRTRFNFGDDAGRFFIISITVRLRHTTLQPPFYNSLQKYITEHKISDFSPINIRKIVCEIRSSKLPDPEKIASAGSFFKNVYLSQPDADDAEERGIPVWRMNDDSGKINSGWLIENCGLKGKELHGFRVSDQAALVLINESAESYADLDAARTEIIHTVNKKFGFTLEQEPVEMPIKGEEK